MSKQNFEQLFSGLLVLSFFLPWVDAGLFTISAMNYPGHLSSFAPFVGVDSDQAAFFYVLYLIPVLAVAVVLFGFQGKNTIVLSLVLGALSIVLGGYFINSSGFAFGTFIAILAGLGIVVTGLVELHSSIKPKLEILIPPIELPVSSYKTLFLVLLILIGAFTLRLFHLGDIPGSTFDEVFYPRYGFDYLTGETFFYSHPPLGNYIYTVAIWIYSQLPWIDLASIDSLTFEQLPPLSYRWINAVFGSLLCLLAYFLAKAVSKNKIFALIVSFFVAIDGSLLVDSRFALPNVFIVFFGLSALLCAAKSQSSDGNERYWLLFCGIFLGLTASVKWNGLGYMLIILSFFLTLYFINRFDIYRFGKKDFRQNHQEPIMMTNSVPKWEYLLYILATPLLVYVLVSIPDLQFNTEYGFIEKQQQMLGYHQYMVEGNEHPYCSKWYSWPLMIRPIGYFFSSRDAIDAFGNEIMLFQDVHLFPNPFLYWFSAIAILTMLVQWLKLSRQWISQGIVSHKFYLFLFILIGYFANLLPWAFVSRCLFLYHYQPASVFAFLALAWYLTQLIRSESLKYRVVSWGILTIIVISFLYWLPFQLGITLESDAFYARMWFQSWI
jgi:dolichyl-phosphate-mannose-protein mannosyltransferase